MSNEGGYYSKESSFLNSIIRKFNNSIISIDMPLTSVIRLSVSEAARMFGVSQRTVRRAITNQEVTYVVVQGRYKINFESLLKWSQDTTTIRNKRDKAGLGQFVVQWRIKNKMFSPNPKVLEGGEGSKG
jgi:excisionase family DNA binding protein